MAGGKLQGAGDQGGCRGGAPKGPCQRRRTRSKEDEEAGEGEAEAQRRGNFVVSAGRAPRWSGVS